MNNCQICHLVEYQTCRQEFLGFSLALATHISESYIGTQLKCNNYEFVKIHMPEARIEPLLV